MTYYLELKANIPYNWTNERKWTEFSFENSSDFPKLERIDSSETDDVCLCFRGPYFSRPIGSRIDKEAHYQRTVYKNHSRDQVYVSNLSLGEGFLGIKSIKTALKKKEKAHFNKFKNVCWQMIQTYNVV